MYYRFSAQPSKLHNVTRSTQPDGGLSVPNGYEQLRHVYDKLSRLKISLTAKCLFQNFDMGRKFE